MIPKRGRQFWLVVLAIGVATFVAFAPPVDQDIAEPILRIGQRAAPAARAAREAAPDLLALRPRAAPGDSGNAFPIGTWVPVPKPAPAAVPAPPMAPPFPFRVIGKGRENDEWMVFLVRGSQTVIARNSQSLDGDYRVDEIRPPQMTVTYLPLNLKQSISIGEAY